MKEKSQYMLGIETSTRKFSVAVTDGEAPVAELSRESGRALDRLLIPSIEEILKTSGIPKAELFGIAASTGPGYFTGIRIGLAAAKGIAFALKKPAAGVSSLENIAMNAAPSDSCLICALTDAGRSEVYAAVYRYSAPDGRREEIMPHTLTTAEALPPILKEKTVLLSENEDAARKIKSALGDGVIIMPPEFGAPTAINTAVTGFRRLLDKKTGPHDLRPVYIKNPDAEENFRLSDPGITITPVERDEIDAVLQIERASFPTPWTREMFLSETLKEAGVFIAARSGEKIIGYACGWFAADEFHLANLAVSPELRGRGAGKKLLQSIIRTAEDKKIGYLVLEVRHRNLPAINLYTKFGFKPVANRKGYYADTGEDAILMAREFDSSSGG